MIGSALKKFATENGLKVSNGVAYGSLRGYAVTLSEGAGYKQFVFSADFSDPAGKVRFMDQIATISEATWQKTYSVRNIAVQPKGIRVLFNDTVGTMKKVQVFLDWFIPILEQCGADRADICTHCGAQTSSGRWYLINGVARYMHEACAQSVNRQIEQTNEEKKDAIAGSYITGAIGAVIGALVGSLAWAVLQMAGYFASIIGLAMGWLADKGYTLAKGRPGKGKVIVLIAAVLLGVAVGILGGTFLQILQASDGSSLEETMSWFGSLLMDIDFMQELFMDSLLGILLGVFGASAIISASAKETKEARFIELS